MSGTGRTARRVRGECGWMGRVFRVQRTRICSAVESNAPAEFHATHRHKPTESASRVRFAEVLVPATSRNTPFRDQLYDTRLFESASRVLAAHSRVNTVSLTAESSPEVTRVKVMGGSVSPVQYIPKNGVLGGKNLMFQKPTSLHVMAISVPIFFWKRGLPQRVSPIRQE